jgi:hypothetical protein
MRLLQRIAEDEVVAEFLRAEIQSKRFGENIRKALGNVDDRIITEPDLNDPEENRYRKKILGDARGYGRNKGLFENFPRQVNWYRAVVSKEELKSVMYINYSYWNELSSGTRLPAEAAKNIQNGVEVFDVSNDGFKQIQHEIRRGAVFPKLIFVSRNERARVVVLEGHARLTAYFLDEAHIPAELEVMIGFSEQFAEWDLY